MDIYCPRCGEPCETDEFHYVHEKTFKQAKDIFFSLGCGVLFNGKECEKRDSLRGMASAMLEELLGDDVDGMAAMLEDFDYAGMLED